MLLVDHFSKYWEITQLNETTPEAVISELKQQFARHGIPKLFISDNGPQYRCQQFREFTDAWKINHHTSSPHHPSGNGTAEAAVKVAKTLIKKTKQDGTDLWLAVLEHRNTPAADNTGSASQMLMSRRTRSLIPVRSDKLEPKVVPKDQVFENQVHQKRIVKKCYDKGSKELPPLVIGQPVRTNLKPQSSSTWSAGRIVEKLAPRSYLVEHDNKIYRRNRSHLRQSREITSSKQPRAQIRETPEVPIIPTDTTSEPIPVPSPREENPSKPCKATPQPQSRGDEVQTSRCGRLLKKPKRLEDYVE